MPTIDLAARSAIDIGGVCLQPSTLTVLGPQARATLEPRVMQLLVALAEAQGQVMARDSLLQACWGELVVGDDALHRAVAGARRALREAGATGLAIETIPRVGYRMVASPPGPPAAEPAADASSIAAAGAAPPTPAPPLTPAPVPAAPPPAAEAPRSRRRLLVTGALAATAVAAVGAWQLRRRPVLSAQARALIVQGQQRLRAATPQGDRQAVACFDQAVVEAPGDPSAWGQLALARRQLADSSAPEKLSEMLASAEASADKALSLDAEQPDALTAHALLVPAFGQWGRVEDALRAVLALAPDHLPALDALAFLLASTGMTAAQHALRLRTVQLDPLHAGYNFRAIYSHWMSGQVAAADLAGERGLELWPRHFATWLARHTLFKFTGRADRALAMQDATDSVPPLPPSLQRVLRATARALSGAGQTDRDAARDVVLRSLGDGGPVAAITATMDLAALGETGLALDVTEAYLLERGRLTTGTVWQPGQALHNDVRRRFSSHLFLPVTAPLRADPRFAEIARDIGLTAHWARAGRVPDHLAAPQRGGCRARCATGLAVHPRQPRSPDSPHSHRSGRAATARPRHPAVVRRCDAGERGPAARRTLQGAP